MIDLTKVLNTIQSAPAATGSAPANQQAGAAQAPSQNDGMGSIMNGLQAVIASAQSNSGNDTETARLAAKLSQNVETLIAKANMLQSTLELAPEPDKVDVSELFEQMRKIISEVDQELRDLQKKVDENKTGMDVQQAPSSTHDGPMMKTVVTIG